MVLPDVNHEAERYVEVFDRLTQPMDPDHKLFGRIGAFSVAGVVLYPSYMRNLVWQVKKVRLNQASRRYVRAMRANYPNEVQTDSTFVEIRRHAGYYTGKIEHHLTNEEGTN